MAINILSVTQKDLSARFAHPSEGGFADLHWRTGPAGNPIPVDVSGWFDCLLDKVVPAGDHTILIGRIARF